MLLLWKGWSYTLPAKNSTKCGQELKKAVFSLFFASQCFLYDLKFCYFSEFSMKKRNNKAFIQNYLSGAFVIILSLYLQAKICEKKQEGISAAELAREYEVHITTIHQIIREGERRRKRRGRPVKTTACLRREIILYFCQNPLESTASALQHFGNVISPTAI